MSHVQGAGNSGTTHVGTTSLFTLMAAGIASLVTCMFLPPVPTNVKKNRNVKNPKPPYLLTSKEKFQQGLGNGSSSTDSPTPTGKTTAAILQPKKGLSSASQKPPTWPFPSGVTSDPKPKLESLPNDLPDSGCPQIGTVKETAIGLLMVTRHEYSESGKLEPIWEPAEEIQKVDHKSGCSYNLIQPIRRENRPQSGSATETATKQLTFLEIIQRARKLSLSKTFSQPTKSEE